MVKIDISQQDTAVSGRQQTAISVVSGATGWLAGANIQAWAPYFILQSEVAKYGVFGALITGPALVKTTAPLVVAGAGLGATAATAVVGYGLYKGAKAANNAWARHQEVQACRKANFVDPAPTRKDWTPISFDDELEAMLKNSQAASAA
ncbi:MAG: hypothetical protein KDK65_02575 [Chlamydiia bacterium]|nr:hypothetical protein [Chlamydiia bacterium]